MSYETPPPGERGYSQDPNQEYPPRPTDRPAPVWPAPHQAWHGSRPVGPNRNKMPWYGWVAIIAVSGFILLAAVAMIVGGQLQQNEDPAPESLPTAIPTAEADTGNDVLDEAGGDDALRNYNATFDDPEVPGDESAYLDHMMAKDRDVYLNTHNDTMLGMGRTVCDALDAGHTVEDIFEMFPDSLSTNTQATTVAASVGYLCDEHFDAVQDEVDQARQ